MHPAIPPRASRPWLALAAVAWVMATVLAPEPAPLPTEPGPYEGKVTLTSDVVTGRFGPWAIGAIPGGDVLVELPHPHDHMGRGDLLTVTGRLGGAPGTASGRPYGGVLTVRRVETVISSTFLPHRAGRAVRTTVERRLTPFDDGRALLSGFLIGDISRISESDIDAMRRSGLAHFVAVSGSNVALFLGLLAIAAGPLALGPRRRAVVGLLALPIYVAATRFEPSVMRASVMAGLALGGRLGGVVLEAWQLLSLAVGILVVVDPVLTSNAGFQLSLAATAGVLVGARWRVKGRFARALAVTLGAQVAVAPLLLSHFGSVPLLSPLVNLAAAPLVAGSTVVGALGVFGLVFLVAPAAWMAGWVLELARGASAWPQLSGWEVVALAIGIALICWLPSLRLFAVGAASVALTVGLVVPHGSLPPGQAVVLDVGQGDSILLNGGGGHFALVDGGPEEIVLVEKLREYGVRSLDLVILSHVHADHATGLIGIVDSVAIGQVWADTEPHATPASRQLFEALDDRGISVHTPIPGSSLQLGILQLVVEGPVRRYASPNDQSIVVTVSGPTKSMLLAGDIETIAQADLDHLRADVLKVPHQGAATSAESWLSGVDSDLAVISVGPNDFGHPADWVVELLGRTNEVRRTDTDGDVAVDLSR